VLFGVQTLSFSFFYAHSFWRKFRARFLPSGCHDAAAQEIETGATVHGAFHDFQPVDLSLDRTGAPGQRQGGVDGFDILTEAPRETFDAAVLGGLIQPSSWSASPCLIMVEKVFAKLAAWSIGGDSASSAVVNRRSSASSLSGSLISIRAALRVVGGGAGFAGGLAGEVRSASRSSRRRRAPIA